MENINIFKEERRKAQEDISNEVANEGQGDGLAGIKKEEMMLTQAKVEGTESARSVKMSQEVLWHGAKSIVRASRSRRRDHKKQEIGRGQWSEQRRFWQSSNWCEKRHRPDYSCISFALSLFPGPR